MKSKEELNKDNDHLNLIEKNRNLLKSPDLRKILISDGYIQEGDDAGNFIISPEFYSSTFKIQQSPLLQAKNLSGKGVIAGYDIPKGTILGIFHKIDRPITEVCDEYGITPDELDLDVVPYAINTHDNSKTHISMPTAEMLDAALAGDIAPFYFINHSDKAGEENVELYYVNLEGMPCIIGRALEFIGKEQELTLNYGKDYKNKLKKSSTNKKSLISRKKPLNERESKKEACSADLSYNNRSDQYPYRYPSNLTYDEQAQYLSNWIYAQAQYMSNLIHTRQAQYPSHMTYDGQAQYPSHMTYDGQALYPSHMTYDRQAQYPSHITYDGQTQYPSNLTYDEQAQYPSHMTYDEQAQYPSHLTYGEQAQYPSHLTYDGQAQYPSHLTYGEQTQYPSHMTYDGQVQYPSNLTYDGQAQYPSNLTYDGQAQYPSHMTYDGQVQYPSHLAYDEQAQYPSNLTYNGSEQHLPNVSYDKIYLDSLEKPSNSLSNEEKSIKVEKSCQDFSNLNKEDIFKDDQKMDFVSYQLKTLRRSWKNIVEAVESKYEVKYSVRDLRDAYYEKHPELVKNFSLRQCYEVRRLVEKHGVANFDIILEEYLKHPHGDKRTATELKRCYAAHLNQDYSDFNFDLEDKDFCEKKGRYSSEEKIRIIYFDQIYDKRRDEYNNKNRWIASQFNKGLKDNEKRSPTGIQEAIGRNLYKWKKELASDPDLAFFKEAKVNRSKKSNLISNQSFFAHRDSRSDTEVTNSLINIKRQQHVPAYMPTTNSGDNKTFKIG